MMFVASIKDRSPSVGNLACFSTGMVRHTFSVFYEAGVIRVLGSMTDAFLAKTEPFPNFQE